MSGAAKVIFLDRDGVINRFPGRGLYVTRAEDLYLLPDSAEAIRLLHEAGYKICVISNQGCVSRGLITKEALHAMTDAMFERIKKSGGAIDGVFYCYHQSADNCDCKKPKTGLIYQALAGRQIDPAQTFFIGDSQEDIEAGSRFGLKTVLVLSGRLSREDIEQLPVKPDYVKKDLLEAARWILSQKF
ncbi:MAG: HAD family hydrolase [Candidatus Omnitrophota bacterium]